MYVFLEFSVNAFDISSFQLFSLYIYWSDFLSTSSLFSLSPYAILFPWILPPLQLLAFSHLLTVTGSLFLRILRINPAHRFFPRVFSHLNIPSSSFWTVPLIILSQNSISFAMTHLDLKPPQVSSAQSGGLVNLWADGLVIVIALCGVHMLPKDLQQQRYKAKSPFSGLRTDSCF